MALIDTEEAGRRLARVILSDIRLYNREKIQSGADLKAELQEGYALFRSRVVPALLPLFESALRADGVLGKKVPPRAAGAPAAPRPAATAAAPARPPSRATAPAMAAAPHPMASPATARAPARPAASVTPTPVATPRPVVTP